MMGDWTLFSNHGHVLVCLARNREARLRDVAGDIGITERAVQKIVHELQSAEFITIAKHGRCNRYEINTRKSLRHALEAQCTVGRLLQLFSGQAARSRKNQDDETTKPETPAVTAQPSGTARAAPSRGVAPAASKPPTAAAPVKKKDPVDSARPAESGDLPDTRKQGSLF